MHRISVLVLGSMEELEETIPENLVCCFQIFPKYCSLLSCRSLLLLPADRK